MELVLPFVDAAIAGHEGPDFLLSLLDSLGQLTAQGGNVRVREIGGHFRVNEKNFLCRFFHCQNHLAYKFTKIFCLYGRFKYL